MRNYVLILWLFSDKVRLSFAKMAERTSNIRCTELNCGIIFSKANSLRTHLIHVHKQHHPTEHYSFASKEDFDQWIEEYEDNNYFIDVMDYIPLC